MRNWNLDDIVCVSEACCILQNMIVRRDKNVEFRNEPDGINVITEFYIVDLEQSRIAAEEYQDNRIRNIEKFILHCHDNVDGMIIGNHLWCNGRIFHELEGEIIELTERQTGWDY